MQNVGFLCSVISLLIPAAKTALNMFMFEKNITSREKDLLKILKVSVKSKLSSIDDSQCKHSSIRIDMVHILA